MLLMTHCRPVLSLHAYIDGDQPCVLEARLQELVSVACTVGSAECHCFAQLIEACDHLQRGCGDT